MTRVYSFRNLLICRPLARISPDHGRTSRDFEPLPRPVALRAPAPRGLADALNSGSADNAVSGPSSDQRDARPISHLRVPKRFDCPWVFPILSRRLFALALSSVFPASPAAPASALIPQALPLSLRQILLTATPFRHSIQKSSGALYGLDMVRPARHPPSFDGRIIYGRSSRFSHCSNQQRIVWP